METIDHPARHHRHRSTPPTSSPAAPTSSAERFVLPDVGRARRRPAAGAGRRRRLRRPRPGRPRRGPERRPAGRRARPAPAGHPPPGGRAAHRGPRGVRGLLARDGAHHGGRHAPGRAAGGEHRARRRSARCSPPRPPSWDAVAAAMALVADADALVLDVRECRGGDPDSVQLLLSHVVGDEPVRLVDIESRVEGVHQRWTQPGGGAAVRPGPAAGGAHLGGDVLRRGGAGLRRAAARARPGRGGAHPWRGQPARGRRRAPRARARRARWPGRCTRATAAPGRASACGPTSSARRSEALDRALAAARGCVNGIRGSWDTGAQCPDPSHARKPPARVPPRPHRAAAARHAAGGDPQLLHHRPHRPRQVDAGRPDAADHRCRRRPVDARAVPRPDGHRARARHHDQEPGRADAVGPRRRARTSST